MINITPTTEVNNPTKSAEVKYPSIIDGALIIAFSSLFSYLIAFSRELGFSAGFGFQRELIIPNPTTIFYTFISIVPIVYILFIYNICTDRPTRIKMALMLVRYGNRGNKKNTRRVELLLEMFCIFFGLILEIIVYVLSKKTIPLDDLDILGLFGFLGGGLLTTMWQLSKKQLHIGIVMPDLILKLSIVFYLCALIFLQGVYSAASQTSFYTINRNDSIKVILRIYGDRIICSSFNRNTKELTGTIQVFSMSDKPEMSLERIGPLHRKTIQ